MRSRLAAAALACATAFGAALPVGSEVIEEIVAKINDDIITKSEFEREEQQMIADLYRRYTGEELDRQVRSARQMLLENMVDRRLMIHRAERLYDMESMTEVLVENFMQQQGISGKKELEQLLTQQGMTLEDLKRRLIEMTAPSQVIGFEVTDRVAIGDKEVDAYYRDHPEEFRIPAEVTLREIVLVAKDDFQKNARRADAESLAQRLQSGEADFETMAKEVSESGTAETGGLMGPFNQGDLMPEIDGPAFSLPIGQVSDVIESASGLHIIVVVSRSESITQDLEIVREKVREQILNERLDEKLTEFIARARSEAEIWINPKYDPGNLPFRKPADPATATQN